MSEKTKTASEIFNSGLNCSQAVLGTFCENYGVEKKSAFKIACGLGSGLRSAEICGAVSGAVLVIGLKYGENKNICNAKTEEFIEEFRNENRDIVCRKILGCDITTPAGKKKAVNGNLFATKCLDMVISAVNILEKMHY